MIEAAIGFPFDKSIFEIKGVELLGDILTELRNHKAALFYYLKGVTLLMTLIQK